jgi:hypothetical protein
VVIFVDWLLLLACKAAAAITMSTRTSTPVNSQRRLGDVGFFVSIRADGICGGCGCNSDLVRCLVVLGIMPSLFLQYGCLSGRVHFISLSLLQFYKNTSLQAGLRTVLIVPASLCRFPPEAYPKEWEETSHE